LALGLLVLEGMSEAQSVNNGLPPRRIQEVAKELQLDPESILT